MKRSYSYFMIKPDGMRFLDNICDTIEQRYSSVRYYAVDDYIEITKKLYYKHYQNKGEKFAKSFDAYLYGLTELFGNQAIMILVADHNRNFEELTQSVYDTKNEIRDKYVNHNIGIVTNYGNGNQNYIKFISEEGKEETPRIMKELGNHRISDMNIIHSPDANKEETLKELNILSQAGILDDKNRILLDMMQQMRKYQTAKFQNDMREPGYQGEIGPDISGFVKKEIKQRSDENFECK